MGSAHDDGLWYGQEQRRREAMTALVFWYRNYRGEEGYRRVDPISIRFGSSEWHKEPLWLLLADDLVNGKRREFAMKDIQSVVGAPTIALHENWAGVPMDAAEPKADVGEKS